MENLIRQRRVSFSEPAQRNMDESSRDNEFVAAVAAAAFAVHSFEEASSEQLRRMKRREEAEASMRNRMSRPEKAPSFARPNADRSLTIRGGTGSAKVDAWERAELLKIHKQYEKSNLTILAWENKKKQRARLLMEQKKKELERVRAKSQQHFQNKLARIDNIAGGAREQVEVRTRNDEAKVKEKAKKMRSQGISSIGYYCFCC